MNISIAEFSYFNAKSQLQILHDKGILLATNKISEVTEARLYVFQNHYVIVHFSVLKGGVLSAEISNNHDWLYFFAAQIDLSPVHNLLGQS
jgi:hypothetical protein